MKKIIIFFSFFLIDCCLLYAQSPNLITTTKPVVTLDTNAICIGSAIDIPFASTGVYMANTYTCELSDSNGTFPSTPIVVGIFNNSGTYDPAFGTPPGSVSGLVPNVTPGCNYYLRVVSSSPVAAGTPWGPFCIGQCDITTNNKQDLNFCVTDCSIFPSGLNSLIPIGINTFNNIAFYNPGNIFTTQLLSSVDFSQIGTNGIFGSVFSTNDTTLNIHIPCKDSLSFYGIPTGMNYLRVIATNSSEPDNVLGSLIRVTIGATNTNLPIITSYDYSAPYDFNLPYPWIPVKDTFCTGETVMLLFEPYNYSDMSTYMWQCSGINGGNPFVSPSGANSNTLYANLGGTDILTFKIQETNYGCVGAWSQEDTVVVLGSPNVMILGPATVCQGDTNLFTVPFSDNTYYSWTSNNGTIVNTANNEIGIIFNTTGGSHTITLNAINQCGSATASKTTIVIPLPPTPTIVANETELSSSASSNNQWYLNGIIIPGATSQTYVVTQNGSYTVEVTPNGNGCSSFSEPLIFSTMGIDEFATNNTIFISPNPSDGKFRIEIRNLQSAKLKIYNTMGEMIFQSEIKNSEIDLSGKPKGIYFIQIGEKIINKKIIIN